MSVTFAATLKDGISGPAQKAASGLESLSSGASESAKALESVDKAIASKKAESLKSLKDGPKKEMAVLQAERANILKDQKNATAAAKKADAEAKKTAAESASAAKKLSTESKDAAKSRAEELSATQNAAMGVAGAYLAAAAAVGGLAITGAKYALDSLMFKESMSTALKYSLGSSEAAAKSLGFAKDIGRTLGIGGRAVAQQLQELTREGFGAGDAEVLTHLGADLKAMAGGKAVDMKPLIGVVGDLRKGAAFGPEALATLKATLPNPAKLYESLAKTLNIKESDEDKRRVAVEKKLAGGKLRGKAGWEAIVQASLAQSGKNAIGDAAKDFSDKTVTGALDKVKTRFEDLFDSIDSTRAGAALLGILNKVADVLDETTPSGARLKATLDKMSDSAAVLLEKIDMDSAIEGFDELVTIAGEVSDALEDLGGGALDGAKEAAGEIKQLMEALGSEQGDSGKGFSDSLKEIGKAVGTLVVFGGAAVAALVLLESKIATTAVSILGPAIKLGASLVDGLIEGIVTAQSKIPDVIKNLADAMVHPLRDALKINSPSKVFMSIGASITEGLTVGIDDGAPDAQAAVRAVISPDIGRGGEALAARASAAKPSVTLNLTVNGGAGAQETADLVVAKVVDALEQMGITAGVVGVAA